MTLYLFFGCMVVFSRSPIIDWTAIPQRQKLHAPPFFSVTSTFNLLQQERFTRVTSVHGLSSAKIPLRKIDDETAMEIGAELIGESAIYAIAVLVLISEGIKWVTPGFTLFCACTQPCKTIPIERYWSNNWIGHWWKLKRHGQADGKTWAGWWKERDRPMERKRQADGKKETGRWTENNRQADGQKNRHTLHSRLLLPLDLIFQRWSNKASEKEAAATLASEQAALLQQQHDQLMRDVDSLKAQVVEVDSLKAQVAAFKSTIKEMEARNSGPTLVPRCKYSDRN